MSAVVYDEKTRERFERFVLRIPFVECWLWDGAHFRAGYAMFAAGGQAVGAHRMAYELYREPIPEGLHLDHLCRWRGCVNPWHLEPVTPRTNAMRGPTLAARNAAKTHCRNGHPFDDANTKIQAHRDGPYRRCRECNRQAKARWRRRQGMTPRRRAH